MRSAIARRPSGQVAGSNSAGSVEAVREVNAAAGADANSADGAARTGAGASSPVGSPDSVALPPAIGMKPLRLLIRNTQCGSCKAGELDTLEHLILPCCGAANIFLLRRL